MLRVTDSLLFSRRYKSSLAGCQSHATGIMPATQLEQSCGNLLADRQPVNLLAQSDIKDIVLVKLAGA